MNKLKHCFGCPRLMDILYSHVIRKCIYTIPNSNGECPCSHCIIKVMCTVRCSDFYTFRQTAKGVHHE